MNTNAQEDPSTASFRASRPSTVESLRGGLIVSCQALEREPLHGAGIMAAMARAAEEGGAVGIRANSAADIQAIRSVTALPIIGIVKRTYPDSSVYITPTLAEVEETVASGADIVAVDATFRPRPSGLTLTQLLQDARARWNVPFMADVSSIDEGVEAARLGFDLVATTLAGYVSPSDEGERYAPDFDLVERMIRIVDKEMHVPVIVEGHIWEPADARRCLELGAFSVVIGSAITRPQLITRRFVRALQGL